MRTSKQDLEELKSKVALGNRILFHQKLADYHGHLSARIPGTRKFLIKPVLAPLGSITRKDIIIVEYTQLKREVNEIAFSIPGGKGKGTCIWEPLNTWEAIFEKNGQANRKIKLFVRHGHPLCNHLDIGTYEN